MRKQTTVMINQILQDRTQIFENWINGLRQDQICTEVIKTIIDDAFEGIIVMDEKLYVKYVNKKHEEYLKIPYETMVNTYFGDWARADVAKGFLEVIRSGKPEYRKIGSFSFQVGKPTFV